MKIFDNVHDIVRDDLAVSIKKGSKISVAAACFSMYAFQELKGQLESVDEFRLSVKEFFVYQGFQDDSSSGIVSYRV